MYKFYRREHTSMREATNFKCAKLVPAETKVVLKFLSHSKEPCIMLHRPVSCFTVIVFMAILVLQIVLAISNLKQR
jgi:hypothetical protein